MANKALPLLLTGGAALLLIGKKKKKKKKSPDRGCMVIETDEQLIAALHSDEFILFPFALIAYPSGKKDEGKQLCQELSANGCKTVAVAAEHMNNFIAKYYQKSGLVLPKPIKDITTPGVAVSTADADVLIPWEMIPWDDVSSLLK